MYAAVEQHIVEYGVTEFIVGHYGGFDRLAASAVKETKRFYPEVRLTLLLPYHPAERPIPTPDGFDGTFYLPGMESVPSKAAIIRANRYVVDHVDYLIAYTWHPASNAQLKEKAGFSANIITRLKRNEYVSVESIEKICRVMECGVDDILKFVPEEK